MITPAYCQQMARYNRWQNDQIARACDSMTDADLRADRGAFFGSIFATLNHVLWGDLLWIARFDGKDGPASGALEDSTKTTQTLAEWNTERFRLDGRISLWAKTVTHTDLSGDVSWYSVAMQQELSKPKAMCVTHFFNHQTHHRGQVHAMLTAAGVTAPVTDIPFMPE